MSEESRTPKENLPEYQQFAHLKTNLLGFREAAKQYKVPATTLQDWVKYSVDDPVPPANQRPIPVEQLAR